MPTEPRPNPIVRAFRQPWTLFRYIWTEVSTPFLGGILFFIFVLLMFQIIRLSDFLVVHNVAVGMIFRLMGYLIVSFLPVVVPIAFLLAVLVGFGRLSADSEVIAMRASGLSLYRLATPVFMQGVLVGLLSLTLNLYLVPWANQRFRYEVFRISNTKAIATIQEGRFTEGFFDMVLYADEIDSKENFLQRVFIYDSKDEKVPVSIAAKSGRIFNNQRDSDGIPGILLRLFDGTMHRNDLAKSIYEYIEFDSYDIFLRLTTSRVVGVEKPKTMNFSTLKRRIRTLEEREKLVHEEFREMNRLKVEYWKRYGLSFACVVFSILGVGFGVVRTRTVRSNSLLICLIVMLCYWLLYTVGLRWGEEGYVPPFISMWISNVLLAIIAAIVIRRAAR